MSKIGLMAWLTFAVVTALAPCDAAEWRLAMLGDTRGERDSTTTGVSTYLTNLAAKIASLNPDIVLVSGDLVNGDDVPDAAPPRRGT